MLPSDRAPSEREPLGLGLVALRPSSAEREPLGVTKGVPSSESEVT